MLSRTWSAIAMHDKYWGPIAPKIRDGGVVLVNDTTFSADLGDVTARSFRVPATDLAAEVGNELAASMVIPGAYAAITGLVSWTPCTPGCASPSPPTAASTSRSTSGP